MSKSMSEARADLVRHVFADATQLLEVAHSIAVTGQRAGLSPREYRRCANRLESTARDLMTLATALPLLICPNTDDDFSDDSGSA